MKAEYSKCNIVSILGTRPEIIRVVKKLPREKHFIIDTGQHYDPAMAANHWKEVGMEPDIVLAQRNFGAIYDSLMLVMKQKQMPRVALCYGDTRSSLAGALAAKDCGMTLVHLESGGRSGDNSMPEERNRKMIDHISDYLFVANKRQESNLRMENIDGQIVVTGDMLYDRLLKMNEGPGNYVLVTIHRQENQSEKRLLEILKFAQDNYPKVLFIIHPAVKTIMLKIAAFHDSINVQYVDSCPHEDVIKLVKDSLAVITDSGGLQREAYLLGKRVHVKMDKNPWATEIGAFGDGNAEQKVADAIMDILNQKPKPL